MMRIQVFIFTLFLLCGFVACTPVRSSQIESNLNAGGKKVIDIESVRALFPSRMQTTIIQLSESNADFAIRNKMEPNLQFELEAYSHDGFKYFFLSRMDQVPPTDSVYFSDPINGVFLSLKDELWFLYGGWKTDMKMKISEGKFKWEAVVSVTKLEQNAFLKPAFKLSYLRNGDVYYSEMECMNDSIGREQFHQLKSRDLKTHPFRVTRSNVKRFYRSDAAFDVTIRDFTDCYFWMGNEFRPSENRFYPAKDYDFDEVE